MTIDHIAASYNILMSKYGSTLQFIVAGDLNRLGLFPILRLSTNFEQVVKVPTRLNPEAILDPIITTMRKFYLEPVTKPPVTNDPGNGKPSDHLVVDCQPRDYEIIQYRPITDSGVQTFCQ